MQQYLLRRLLLVVPTIIGVTIVVSLIVQILPGDAVDILTDQQSGSPEELAQFREDLRHELRLDRSWPEQYADWIWGVVQGDFGTSLVSSERTVWEDLSARIPVTLELAFIALVVGVLIGVPIGVFSALRQDTLGDYAGRSVAIGLLAIPNFWIATIIISILIPLVGLPSLPIRYHGLFADPIENLKQMWVPGTILGLGLAGITMRLTRSQMLEVLRQDYVRTAWAKGLRERTIIGRHALRNALIPIVTVIGVQISIVISGSVVMESIFVLPGMGLRLIRALGARDIPVILAINLFVAIAVVLANLIIDLAYSTIDPRIRYN